MPTPNYFPKTFFRWILQRFLSQNWAAIFVKGKISENFVKELVQDHWKFSDQKVYIIRTYLVHFIHFWIQSQSPGPKFRLKTLWFWDGIWDNYSGIFTFWRFKWRQFQKVWVILLSKITQTFLNFSVSSSLVMKDDRLN